MRARGSRNLSELAERLDDDEQAEQVEQPGRVKPPWPWLDHLMFLAIAVAAGILGLSLYFGGLI